MIFLVIGIAGTIVMGFVTRRFYVQAAATQRHLESDKPFGGAVPPWAWLLYIVFFACALYGLYTIVL